MSLMTTWSCPETLDNAAAPELTILPAPQLSGEAAGAVTDMGGHLQRDRTGWASAARDSVMLPSGSLGAQCSDADGSGADCYGSLCPSRPERAHL